jgi:hypothetical protein
MGPPATEDRFILIQIAGTIENNQVVSLSHKHLRLGIVALDGTADLAGRMSSG